MFSSCLETLHLQDTRSEGEEGDKLLNILANSDINTICHLTIADESAWFKNGREGCIAPLLAVLAKQTNLQSLNMWNNYGITE